MRVQLDRFEDGGRAVLTTLSDNRSFDAPMELLPEDAAPGDVFDVTFRRDDEAKVRISSENRSLMDELLGREDS